MRALSCVLVCEGVSDEWFLPPLLQRATEELCNEQFPGIIEVLPIRCLDADHQRPRTVIAAADEQRGLFDVLLYHRDGAPPRNASDDIARMRVSWKAHNSARPLVPVVPIKETEAWVLADRDALTETLAISGPRVSAVVPVRAGELERLADPKRELAQLVGLAVGKRAAKRHGEFHEDFLDRLATRIRVAKLREVPAFNRWWDDMTEALEEMGYQHG